MRIRELTVAVAELDEALAYYGSIRPRLAAGRNAKVVRSFSLERGVGLRPNH